MADSVELRMSVASIKRADPYVKDILATSTHVALYKFNPVTSEWEKTETEGALFLYSRSGEPFHSIMIMNRLNTNNLIEPIVKEFEYQMQPPFLLYRNPKNKIFGIWFYNREECVKITYLLESLMDGLKEKQQTVKKHKEQSQVIDIFSMLTKAQEDFSKTTATTPTGKSDGQPQFSTPRAPDVTSQSVMDFFAKAGSKTAKQPSSIGAGESENLLQRLMSNPAHSVEHIEKQQRSITPHEDHQTTTRPKSHSNNNAERRSIPIVFPGGGMSFECKPENGLSFVQSASPQSLGTTPLQGFLLGHGNREEPLEVVNNVATDTSPVTQLLDSTTPIKPALMPPMMFASSKEKPDLSTSSSSSAAAASTATTTGTATENVKYGNNVALEPLTKNQMLQALSYLLRNDPDFVQKLHEAYVKSLTEMVVHHHQHHNNSNNNNSSLL